MNVSQRPITDHDHGFLFRVYASTRADEMAMTGWNPEQIRAFLTMQFQLQHAHYCQHYNGAEFLVVEENRTPVGRLYLHRSEDEIRIMDIALLPEYRGRGIGRRLINDLIKEADQNQKMLSLHVEQMNPIRSFYARLGFTEVETRGIYLFMRREPKPIMSTTVFTS